jgi:hypothetical protein
MRHSTILFLFYVLFSGCSKDPVIVEYKTKNVIIITVDGPRFMETWGESNHQFIPFRSALANEAVVCMKMYNEGETHTLAGHTSLLTGYYQTINNSGLENPQFPSFLQSGGKSFGLPTDKTWIISSKDKIEALGNCMEPGWKDSFLPMTDCGNSGFSSGYRFDSTTFKKAKIVLTTFHPSFALIHFREPDYSAHANDSLKYLQGIRDTDSMAVALINHINNDPFYFGNTTIIITNDHGRHLPGQGGYSSHGDNCDGCRHIEFFAIGPDFKKNYVSHQRYSMIDITATIAEITGMKMEFGRGEVMWDVLRDYNRW